MVTMREYMEWRTLRADLSEAEAAGLVVGWVARPGGGVVVVELPAERGTLTYDRLREADAFLDGWKARSAWTDPAHGTAAAVVDAAITASAHAVAMEAHHMMHEPGHPPADPFCQAFNAYRDVVGAVMDHVGAAKVLDMQPRAGRQLLEAPFYDRIHGARWRDGR